jgi:carbon-monoxide dehydrogenase large subunit
VEFKDGRFTIAGTDRSLGVKSVGEAGTVGSLLVGVNAIVDALSVLGIKHIDTPCTPFKVWRAIQGAKRNKADGSKIG